ncbi:hypothetical protein [Ferrimonas pelagia]|uniref:MSHA biogenesis protein MshJ n=1 Tax=Ferrimonas pelagia TaxID=1177826 RepID=A0ABP9FGZ3_9GAMM
MSALRSFLVKFAELSRRERVLIAASLWLAVGLGGSALLYEPLLVQQQRQAEQVTRLQQEQQTLRQQISTVEAQLNQDPNAPLQQRRAQLERQIVQQQEALEQELVDLVLPEQMSASLAKLLARAEGVSLIRMQILASESLVPQGGLFRHGVELELQGNYFDLMAALQRMEQLEQRFYWRDFSYQVSDYPTARLTLRLDTLGTEEEPIRVGHDHTADAGAASWRR